MHDVLISIFSPTPTKKYHNTPKKHETPECRFRLFIWNLLEWVIFFCWDKFAFLGKLRLLASRWSCMREREGRAREEKNRLVPPEKAARGRNK